MAQHDYIIANQSGAALRADLNNGLAAIVSNNSGATEPATTYAYQWWADTTAGLLKLRNAANNAWITLRELDGTLTIENGTASSPGLAFADDLNTGIYSPSADQLGITTGGTVRLTTTTTGITSALPVDVPIGTASAPTVTFTGDLNSGIYSPGADQVAITTNGVERVKFGTTEVVFNDGGADIDFRVEGDTKANLLLVDAGADTVSIDGTQQLANQTPLRFGDSNNSHYVALRSPATVSTNVTWDLPATDGTVDQVLKTNGSGVLGWSSAGAFASTSEVSGTHTTGTVTSGSASLTVASATGIVAGMFIVGEGIAPGTTVSSIASTTVTMSANAGATLSSDPVAFYIANKSLSPGLVAGQLCRAWVNFNGTGTVAIRASFNVSSITDNGVGLYTVNFTTAMVDANYSIVYSNDANGTNASQPLYPSLTSTSAGSAAIKTGQLGALTTGFDQALNCVAIFR